MSTRERVRVMLEWFGRRQTIALPINSVVGCPDCNHSADVLSENNVRTEAWAHPGDQQQEASRRGDVARDAAHAAAPAPKREVHYGIVAFDIGPNGCGINATRFEILSRCRFIHQLGTFAAPSGPAN
jgi:hypothetical protein